MIDIEKVLFWLGGKEDEHTEFKEAKSNFDLGRLTEYCVALSNEGGGRMIFGVTDAKPREVVGTSAFPNLEQTKHQLLQRIHIRVDAEELWVEGKRLLAFIIPPRAIGRPVHYKGRYLMRSGESIVPMTPEQLRSIFAEFQLDFSAQVCPGATIYDLDPAATEVFKKAWAKKSGNLTLLKLDTYQLLEDAELITDGITNAALILLGAKRAVSKYLPQAETVFEYRSSEASTNWQDRVDFKEGFFLFMDRMFELINLRNDTQHFQQGLFIWDIPTFRQDVIREALLNAICHRDYRRGESVFVLQYPRRLEIISPGGLPEGITLENILDRQSPRNRRLAEVLQKCGLVERSGQGLDRMFESSVKDSKPLPDFSRTDENQVSVVLKGTVSDTRFLRLLEEIQKDSHANFSLKDLLVLNLIKEGMQIPEKLLPRLQVLMDARVIEKIGRGRGRKYILSQRFFAFAGEVGSYTRAKGLDKETNKMLILKHIDRSGKGRISELEQVLPALTRNQIHALLKELKQEGSLEFVGAKASGVWKRA